MLVRTTLATFLFVASLACGVHLRADEPKLDQHLQPFAPYVGKTWRGEFKGSTKDKPLFDVSRWEVALKGKAIRTSHAISDGSYGGESIIMWDAAKKTLVSFYFTTAGFFTEGTVEFKDGKMIAREVVRGQQPGVTEVESVSELQNGQMHAKARFLKEGKWVDGHEITYVEAPDAVIKID
jgi:hypothetical protein